MVYAPIYKDTYYTTTASTLEYRITYNGETIFAGISQKMPNGDNIKININRICQNYLHQDIDTLFDGAVSERNYFAIGDFVLANGNGTTLETYKFLYCYDYDFTWTGSTGVTLSYPICDVYGDGMMSLRTYITSSRQVYTEATPPASTLPCVKYGLYYVNARGGWDAFAIQGTAVKTDSITQYTTDKSYDNTTRDFETNRYMTEITSSYVFNTHYLNDEESANLSKNLMSSNLVYLHNLEDGTIRPVIITDKSVTYQTYQTNGKKMAQYKINVKESQSKLRK